MKTVLVCGGRSYANTEHLSEFLHAFHTGPQGPIGKIVHGAAPGADSLAGRWAKGRGIEMAVYPANWIDHGRSAGPKRNAQMLREEKIDVVIAFPGGRGTSDMKHRAALKKITVIEAA